METWRHATFKGVGDFNGTVVGVSINIVNLVPPLSGCFWELRKFYYHIHRRGLNKWLAGHGRAGMEPGAVLVQRIALLLIPCVPATIVQSYKARTSCQKDKATIVKAASGFQEYMVSSGWLLAFLLSFASQHGQRRHKSLALSILEVVVATACEQRDLGLVWDLSPPERAVRVLCQFLCAQAGFLLARVATQPR